MVRDSVLIICVRDQHHTTTIITTRTADLYLLYFVYEEYCSAEYKLFDPFRNCFHVRLYSASNGSRLVGSRRGDPYYNTCGRTHHYNIVNNIISFSEFYCSTNTHTLLRCIIWIDKIMCGKNVHIIFYMCVTFRGLYAIAGMYLVKYRRIFAD